MKDSTTVKSFKIEDSEKNLILSEQYENEVLVSTSFFDSNLFEFLRIKYQYNQLGDVEKILRISRKNNETEAVIETIDIRLQYDEFGNKTKEERWLGNELIFYNIYNIEYY